MGIVIITIPGEDKRIFANSLHELTKRKVDLVVIQKAKAYHPSLISRLWRLYQTVGLFKLPREIWYALLLRLDKRAENVLGYFKERNGLVSLESSYLPKVMEVNSINDEEVFKTLQTLKPDLI